MFRLTKTIDVKSRTMEGIEISNRFLGTIGVNYAKALCPVLTGRARNSISYLTSKGVGAGILSVFLPENSVAIGSNVEYFPAIEFGTRRRAAKPTLAPSMAIVRNQLPNIGPILLRALK